MKKIINLLLVLVLSFSLFAGCEKKNNDSTSESTGTNPPASEIVPESPPEESTIPDGSTTGAVLADALASQIEEASSLKIEIEVNQTYNSVYYRYIWDGEVLTDEVETLAEYYESKSIIEAVLSVDEDGKLDAEIEQTVVSAYDPDDELEPESEETIYVIDNNVYLWDEDFNAWVNQTERSDSVVQIVELVKSIKNGELISAEDKEKLYAELGEFINTTFSIREYKGTISFDGVSYFNDLYDYFSEFDTSTKTVSEFLDDALKLIDEDLTTQSLLAKIEEFAGLTVSQAIAKIDTWLTENYQTTLQDIYDKLVASDQFVSFILDSMGAPTQDRTELIAQIKAMTIDEAIADFKDVPLYDLFMASAYGEDYPTIDSFFDNLEEMLALTIDEFEANVLPVPIISLLSGYVQCMTVNRFDAKMDIQFTNIFRIDSIYGELNYDIKLEQYSTVEGKTNLEENKYSATVKISEISKDARQIAVPEGDKVLDFLANGYYSNPDADFYNLWVYPEGNGKALFHVEGDLPSGVFVSLRAQIPVSALENSRIEVDPESVEIYADNGVLYETTLDKSIIVQIYGDSFVVEQMPDLGIADDVAWVALDSIEYGEGIYTLDPNLGIESEFGLWENGDDPIIRGLILFVDDNPISSISFTAVRDYETGNLVCTITGYQTYFHLYGVVDGKLYVGSRPDEIPELFGGDIEFTFYVEDGVVKCDDMPTVLSEYIVKE